MADRIGAFHGGQLGCQFVGQFGRFGAYAIYGPGLYVVAEAIIFTPLLFIASDMDPMIIPIAGLGTLVLFGVMTAVVFITRKDFSFMRSALMFGGFAAMGLIVVAILTGFTLGPIFTIAMIALACGYILYDTSNVLHHYRHRSTCGRSTSVVCRSSAAVLVYPASGDGIARLNIEPTGVGDRRKLSRER